MLLDRIGTALAPPLCTACLGHAGRAEPLCASCRTALRWLGPDPVRVGDAALWAPVAYEGPARALVGALKFRGALGLARTMSAQIASGAPRGWLSARGAARPPPVLVPVPLHVSRRRRRGFNQAELLAGVLADRRGLDTAICLERAGPPLRQVGRDRAERARAIAGGVRMRPGARAPARALLVDDVATTGATLVACAATLRGAGSEEVRAVAYARTPGR